MLKKDSKLDTLYNGTEYAFPLLMMAINPKNQLALEQFSSAANELMKQCPMFKHGQPLPVDFSAAREDNFSIKIENDKVIAIHNGKPVTLTPEQETEARKQLAKL